MELSSEGKKRAKAVESARMARAAHARKGAGSSQWGAAAAFAIPVFIAVYLVAALLWRVPSWDAGIYVAASALAFVLYAVDKSAAAAGTWRISESKLLLVGLVGGWPGAIIAQQVFRHKSGKASFRSVFWASVLLNVAGFLIVFSPLAKQILSTLPAR